MAGTVDRRVDLNADVGEWPEPGAAAPRVDNVDEPLLALVTTAHVACGFHAGGPEVMRRTVEAALARGVVVGAHPSYPDPEGFGRRPLDRSPEQVARDVVHQVEVLEVIARAAGTAVRSVKPHGALYQRVAVDGACARAVAEALAGREGGLVLVLPAGAPTRSVVEDAGVAVAAEGFCDRGYLADGTLAPRTAPGGLLTDPEAVARRALALARGAAITTADGTTLELACDTLCVHGDTPGAVALAAAVRRALGGAGVTVAALAPPGAPTAEPVAG